MLACKRLLESGYYTTHRMLGKSPNEMTRADVDKNTAEKRQHNDEVMNKSYDNLHDKSVGILNKKNIFDKGSKTKSSRDNHDIVSSEGYNIKLDNDRSYPPKDIVVLKNKS